MNKLSEYVETHGIKEVADRMGYTYAYIHQLATGKFPITDKVRYRMRKLDGMKPPAPVVPVRCSSKEVKDFIIDALSNQEREAALLAAAKERTE